MVRSDDPGDGQVSDPLSMPATPPARRINRQLPVEIAPAERRLTAADFQRLADVPPEVEWFSNIKNKSTRRAYEKAIRDFIRFTGIARPEEFRTVTRAHVIAWRDDLAGRALGGATVRHRLAAFLLRLAQAEADRKTKEIIITLPASNQELASQIGTVRELVSRNLSRLQAEGLIRMDGRTVVLCDIPALEAELHSAD